MANYYILPVFDSNLYIHVVFHSTFHSQTQQGVFVNYFPVFVAIRGRANGHNKVGIDFEHLCDINVTLAKKLDTKVN